MNGAASWAHAGELLYLLVIKELKGIFPWVCSASKTPPKAAAPAAL